MDWSRGIPDLAGKFKALPSSERAKIIHTIIMYKSPSKTVMPIESELGRFQVVTLNHLASRGNQ